MSQIRKSEIKEKIQDYLGTKVGSIREIPEAVFLNKAFFWWCEIDHLAKLTGTEDEEIIKYAKQRVRNIGLAEALKQTNDRTQLAAFLKKHRKIKKKDSFIDYGDDDGDY
ncbi:MAG: hypothetical protein JRJ62_12015 [Deltaproteobacteria bacterium]|nr:hypothetical protein [Deltaproteobacteria bacterium]